MASDGNVKAKSQTQSGLIKFFREVKAEFKRITWPSKKEIKKSTIAVAVFCLLYIVYVGGIDVVFKNLFDLIFRIK
ncbi:preprotein translocase subunit SecE [Desnuesiella massiliensis]|uniref:preprotein translocase subunit SecE n=1 Tax=Desnuesiella massiliensis TaxID=1650662 RepID=UPI0006E39083|nr:preprotein translocase subunit SecE [Desnuesiella massiliensis]